MTQKFTVLFDLDGTLVDTAPDLMLAHNHVMKKFGYPTKSLDELKNTVGSISTFFPILVSLEKKTVSGPFILTPFFKNLSLSLFCKF